MSRDPSDFEKGSSKKGGTIIEEKKFYCYGCKNEFLEVNFTKTAMLCLACAESVCQNFGLKYGYANLAKMKTNIPFYLKKVPRLGNFNYRSQCRILAAAAGSDGVLNLSQEESAIIQEIQKFIEKIYKPSDREEPMQRVMAQTESW